MTSQLVELLRSLRLAQWIKNTLVFAPLVLGGRLDEPPAVAATALAFVALGLAASATYLVNDILDAPNDRQHWSKRDRPIARGSLSPRVAAIAAAALFAGGFGLAAMVSLKAFGALLIYVVLSLAYSVALKRVPILDALLLAILFTMRLGLGAVAANVPPSPWLFVFSMFVFTSLSFTKRYAELRRSAEHSGSPVGGRGYRIEDQPLLVGLGVAAGVGSVIILILYIIEDAYKQSFYGSSSWLWGFPLIVFLLVSRLWLVTLRGEMNDDPVAFVLTDRISLALLVLLLVCFYIAWAA